MNTSILTVVLGGMLLAGQNATPTWQENYGQAQLDSTAQNKPLAVVFGSGANGWTKVIREAPPAPEVMQALADKYICVYVDTSTPAGKKLAEGFGITSNLGLVISDRTGQLQAFWHQGDMSNDVMTRSLQRYASSQSAVTRTETFNTSRSSFYPASEATGSSLGGASPFGSSYCPSCNNARGHR
jgi:hypothetical protein